MVRCNPLIVTGSFRSMDQQQCQSLRFYIRQRFQFLTVFFLGDVRIIHSCYHEPITLCFQFAGRPLENYSTFFPYSFLYLCHFP